MSGNPTPQRGTATPPAPEETPPAVNDSALEGAIDFLFCHIAAARVCCDDCHRRAVARHVAVASVRAALRGAEERAERQNAQCGECHTALRASNDALNARLDDVENWSAELSRLRAENTDAIRRAQEANGFEARCEDALSDLASYVDRPDWDTPADVVTPAIALIQALRAENEGLRSNLIRYQEIASELADSHLASHPTPEPERG